FGMAYLLAIAAAFLPLEPAWPKLVVAGVLIVLYGWYVKGHLEADSILEPEGLNPLRLRQLDRARAHLADDPPRLRIVNLQLLAGVVAIVVGAVAFVDGLTDIAPGAGPDA